MSKVRLTIDDRPVEAEADEAILQVALANDIYIPHLCYHPEVGAMGACRLCTVDIGNGQLATACRTTAEEGMVVRTNTDEVDRAVRPVAELIVANHHISCRGCPSNSKCQLQSVMAHLRIDRRRVRRLLLPEKERALDETFSPCFDYDADKCILCGICIRTCEQIHGTGSLFFANRGTETRVTFYGDESRCQSCRECAERCPVGVLLLR